MKEFIIFLFIFFGFCYAGITPVDDSEIPPSSVIGWRYAAVTPYDTPFGESFPRLNFHYVIKSSNKNSTVTSEAVLFHSRNKNYFGYSGEWCCTEELYKNGDCNTENSIIINYAPLQLYNLLPTVNKYLGNNNSDVFYWPRITSGFGDTITMDGNIQLKISGVWYFVIADCQQSNNSILLQGSVTFHNPFGYLSAALFPNIPVYISIGSAYFGVLVVWVAFLCIYRKNIIGIQRIITATILSGLFEETLWAAAWAIYNYTGIINEPFNLIGAMLTTVKLTFIRTLVLLVSVGYSLIYPTLELCPKLGVITLTFLYGCVVGVYQYVVVLNHMGIYSPQQLRWSMLLLQVILNGIYVIWIAYSIYVNMKALNKLMDFEKTRKEASLKLKMYNYLAGFLGVFAVFSIICFCLEMFYNQSTFQDSEWSLAWIFTAYWEFAYFFITLLITFLWRPNPENLRFQMESYIELEEVEPVPLHLQEAPPEYSFKEEPKSPLFMSHAVKKDDDEVSEMDELIL